MIDKKVILYILFGILLFALWEAWQKDYGQTNIQEQSQSTTTNTKGTAVPGSLLTYNNPAAIPAITSTQKTSTPQEIIATPESRIVRVHTDVLDVAIDTIGGNVIRADLLKYPEVIYKPKPIRFLDDNFNRYYVAQSGLLGDGGPDSNTQPAKYTVSQKEYTLDPTTDSVKVKLLWRGAKGISVAKVFTFTRNKYDIVVDYEIDNNSNKPWTGQFYAELKRKEFDTKKGWFQFNTYTGAAVSSAETPYEKISFSAIEEATKNKKELIRETQGGWVAMQQRYFLSTWVPAQDKTYRYFNSATDGIYIIGFSDNNVIVPAGKKTVISSVLYAGPQINENIAHLAKGLDRTVDYGVVLWFICVGFFWVLKRIYQLVGNWGGGHYFSDPIDQAIIL